MHLKLDPELERQILKAGWIFRSSTGGHAALRRLVQEQSAIRAWDALSKLKPKDEDFGLWSVVTDIAREAARGRLKPHEKRTKAQIAAAARKASKHAKELVQLMTNHASLRFNYEDLFSPREADVWYRILFGIAYSGYKFARKVEAQLNQRFPKLRTVDAYKALNYQIARSDYTLANRLVRFVDLAAESARTGPDVRYPRRWHASAQRFAIRAADTIKHRFGRPHLEIVTDLTSAAFNLPDVDADPVKKWWQRRHRRDNLTE